MRFKRNKEKELEGNLLIEGLEISGNFYDKNENRILTLLLKGIIVYLVTAGMLGGTITATGTEFNQVVFNVVVFVLSMIISLIYYNKKSENIGDIAYLFMIIFFGVAFGTYINSGFYAWMNDVIGAAGAYFDLPDIGGYVQAVRNTRLAVTFASCYLGAVCVILVNMSIVKRMMYGDLILNAMIVLFLPVYMELEPNYVYNVMMICGIVMSVIWKIGGRYEKTDNNSVYVRNKKEITYTYCFKGHVFAFAQILIPVLIILLAVYIIMPKDTFELLKGKSENKEITDDIVETFITSGFAGFFNRYDNIGGMNSGRLGGVNSVRLDYETDLVITYAPYNLDPVYLRTFIGGDYHPYQNFWSIANPMMLNRNEYEQLKAEYDAGNPYSTKCVMDIDNQAGDNGEYALYYSDKDSILNVGRTASRTFYPANEQIGPYLSNEQMTKQEREYWLTVPNDNVPSIINTLQKLNITDDMDEMEIAERIREYYFDNIPYTLRPGSTPIRRDFINYFLDTNKKGYCVHFASAAVLMFRYMGIPARYVEGYAVDYNDITNGKAMEELNKDDYLTGFSELPNVPVVSIDVTDASAHAWVEIYTDDKGWVNVELTPPSSDIENDSSTLWDRFLRLLSPQNIEDTGTDATKSNNIDTAKIRRNLIIFITFIFIMFIAWQVCQMAAWYLRYNKADTNNKLIILYHQFIKRASKKKDLKNAHNYREQINELAGNDKENEKLIGILEKAGFSNKQISQSEFEYSKNKLKEIKRGIKK